MTPEEANGVALKAIYQHYALQKAHELTFLLCLLEKDDTVVEIGCDAGGTSWAIEQVGVRRIIGIDLPGEVGSSGLAWQGTGQTEMIWGDSHKKETKQRLEERLDGDRINFLFIDGDHSYTGVAEDFRMYSRLVTGLVAFHDIVVHEGMENVQVNKFWNEIKGRYPYVEYVAEYDPSWGGIGVIDLSYSGRLHNALSEAPTRRKDVLHP